MRVFMALFSVIFLSSMGFATDRVVSESDSGIVFGDVDCFNFDHAAEDVRFSEDFEYLFATVDISMECVTRSGRLTTLSGSDTVLFPELTFDWMEQSWFHGEQLIASIYGWDDVVVNPELDISVWTDMGDEYVALKIQFLARDD